MHYEKDESARLAIEKVRPPACARRWHGGLVAPELALRVVVAGCRDPPERPTYNAAARNCPSPTAPPHVQVSGMLLEGKKVFVGPFLRRSERSSDSETKFTNVFVKNLDEGECVRVIVLVWAVSKGCDEAAPFTHCIAGLLACWPRCPHPPFHPHF